MHEVENQDKALLVVIDPKDKFEAEGNTIELRLLCESANVEVVDEIHIRRDSPDPRFYFGSGNAEECSIRIKEFGANVMIVGAELSPSQQRNLTKATEVRCVDRTQLILDIFALRARTNEGKLQVELAQLQYLLPRLSGRGIEMSRIGGSSGGGVATRGPGETKLETDRRRVRDRISVLKDSLEEVVEHRTIQNKSRRNLKIPNIALVGYTSAGKSTLLNKLAGSEVEAHARLFATLDPTTRKVDLPDGCSFILSDTVGFLRNLPHKLVAAFRATLEEVVEADFLIHVVDASHLYMKSQIEAVEQVLAELGAGDKFTIIAYNKCDLVEDQYSLRKTIADTPNSSYISALSGDGIEYLIRLIVEKITESHKIIDVIIPFSKAELLDICHKQGRVILEEYIPEGIKLSAEIPSEILYKFDGLILDTNV